MEREIMINKLKSLAPVITNVAMTYDMGYEFSAVVPEGVIYAETGMLLSYSGGDWPPSYWIGKSKSEYEELLRAFLLDVAWKVTSWNNLSVEEMEQWLKDVIYKTTIYECIEIIYSMDNGLFKISFSTYIKNVNNEAISACEWNHLDERKITMKPIINEHWDMVEQILGYAVNDNFTGNLPFEETRYFSINDDGIIEYSSDFAEIEAKIIIRKC
ncbi:MAG: hypothetical protein HQK63_14300 [Desulfamplus sp.]|nr:hypothetical protein [Desulfamplus sp.]